MQTKAVLTLTEIDRLLAAGRAEAERQGWAVSIAVCDDGGHPLALLRLDGAPPNSAYIAPEKARSAALARKESRLLEEMINNGRTAFLSVPQMQGLLEGGVPILVAGQVVGAVGVSGVKSPEDAQVAHAALAALA